MLIDYMAEKIMDPIIFILIVQSLRKSKNLFSVNVLKHKAVN